MISGVLRPYFEIVPIGTYSGDTSSDGSKLNRSPCTRLSATNGYNRHDL
jgi:hypothetical protein